MAQYKFVNADQLDADLQTVADKIREKSQTSNSLAWPSGFIEGIDQCGTLIKPETGLVIYDSGAFGRNSNGIAFDANCVDDGEKVISIVKNAAYMQWNCGEKTWGLFYIAPSVSCNGYKTLNISLTNVSASVDNEGVRWGLAKTIDAESPQFAAYKQYDTFSNNMTLTLDVSGVGSTACYIALRVSNDVGDSFSARVTKIWLE